MGAIVGSLFKIAEYTLGIYQTKQARKHLDRVIYLKKRYYEEENKPDGEQNHAVMDNIVNELCIITESITSITK